MLGLIRGRLSNALAAIFAAGEVDHGHRPEVEPV
jgi:hypothetical protein